VKRTLARAVFGLSVFLVLGCSPSAVRPGKLNVGGATFVYPIMDKWASIYEKAIGVQVNYNSIGSGGGIQQMTAKTFDFGCSDVPMNEEQLHKARQGGGDVVHIPLVLGAVVPAYNLPGVEQPLRFTGPVLADIFLGNIHKWNDPALQELNSGVPLPDQNIAIVHRSDGSGTTHIWVEYLAKVSPAWKKKVGVGTSVNWPVGVGQKGNEGVTRHIGQTPGAIGYIELIYALSNQIKYGAVKNAAGQFIVADLVSVTAAAESVLATIPDDLRYSLTEVPGRDSYPISGTNWAIVYLKPPSGKGQLIVDFLRWATHEGQQYTESLHYARLPKGLVERLEKKLDLIQVE
jgi:phosphate ABC transporter phosphate-binding protein